MTAEVLEDANPETRTLFLIDPNQKLLGTVVVWNVRGIKGVPYAKIVADLQAADLDPDNAKKVLPRNAFISAAHKLEKGKVISKLKDEEDRLYFQFTLENKAKDAVTGKESFVYDFETILNLDKTSGVVACDEPGHADLIHAAQELVDEAIANRNGGQISKIVQRIFENHADLFPIRDQGGVYFIPIKHKAIQGKVAQFLKAVGGKLAQMPIPLGTPEGNDTARDAVTGGLQKLIDDHRKAIDELKLNTRDDTLERAAQKIAETRFKIEAYADYLSTVAKEELLGAVEDGYERLKKKTQEIEQARQNP